MDITIGHAYNLRHNYNGKFTVGPLVHPGLTLGLPNCFAGIFLFDLKIRLKYSLPFPFVRIPEHSLQYKLLLLPHATPHCSHGLL